MPIQSLNWNDKIRNLAGGDNLSDLQKKSLMDQYNSNIPSIQNQLGYLPSYGPTTNPSRSAVQVINSAYDTSGNGGRKVTRLINGTLVSVSRNATNFFVFYSFDNGSTWIQKQSVALVVQDISITSVGNKVYVIITNQANQLVRLYYYDEVGISILGGSVNVDTSQTATGNVSLTYSPTDNTLHAAWSSKNATYPNSFNIRYAKGTINGDGSVTWGSVEQRTTDNTSGSDCKNPSIVIKPNGLPVIIIERTYTGSNAKAIESYVNTTGTTWTNNNIYQLVGTYTQSSPSAIFVPQSINGLTYGRIWVAWEGLDSTDTTAYNIRVSYSDDGGVTWSAMTKLTTGNAYPQFRPTITYNQSNNIFVYWYGNGVSNTNSYRIKSIVNNGTWGSVTDITTNVSGQPDMRFPSLCDNVSAFTSPLVIWKNDVASKVSFSGTWTDTPLLSETTSISRVSNKALIDAYVSANYPSKKSFASGSGGTITYTGGNSVYTVTSTSFKPSKVIVTLKTSTTNWRFFNSIFDATKSYIAGGSGDNASITYNSNGFTLSFIGSDFTVAGYSNISWVAIE